MKVVTAEEIRTLDRRAITEFRIPGVVLMENAGYAVVGVMEQEYGTLTGKRVAVFCGTGNNGGDGFVIARYLHLAGAMPLVSIAGRLETLKDDARVHYELLRRLPISCTEIAAGSWSIGRLGRIDFCVDALLGTGVKEAPRGAYADAIAGMNRAECPTIAVDLPSGVDADTGKTPGEAVQAAHTVTFAYPKLGLFLFPGAEHVGVLHITKIGFDWDALQSPTPYRLLTASECFWQMPFLQKRRPESNKGDYGHVGIVAGSRGMAGAPALVARAAQRAGAGLVSVLAPASVQPAIGAKLDEQMTIPLPETNGALSADAFEVIAQFAERATVLCIGPGLTTGAETVALIHRLITEIKQPLILDADGLNALALRPEIAAKRPDDPRNPLILTPHPGEAARLLGTDIPSVQSDRIGAANELSRRYHAVTILKGRHTLICAPDGNLAINTTGNPGMATGGSGDTLTGILGGLMAQAIAPGRNAMNTEAYHSMTPHPQDVASLGVLLHGMAGDLAAERIGEIGMTAGDIIDSLPHAIRLLEESK